MNVTSAKFISPTKFESESSYIKATINGREMIVPINNNNIEYQAIQEWAKTNTIEEAD